jgi:methionyl-tRNA formyltransferase
VVSLRIVYFGTPQFAVPGLEALLDSPHEVVALVSQPDRPRGRGQKLHTTATKIVAEARGVPVLQPTRLKDPAFLSTLAAFAPDLGVVAAYGRILPDALLSVPRLGMINIHASLLPMNRGAAPVHRAVINGDRTTGVSIMRVVSELDAGPVFRTAACDIGPDDTTPEVEIALAVLGAQLVRVVVDDLASGTAVAVPQDDERATHANKIEKHEGAIDWSLPASSIHNLVRGLQPWPLVSAMLEGRRYLIHRTAVTDRATTEPGGTVVTTDDGDLLVAAGDGVTLRILVIQPEGKRPMTAREFLAGHRINPGARLRRPERPERSESE